MTVQTDFHTKHTAKIGDKYIHHSLQGLTTNRAWAWTPTRDQLANAKRKYELVRQATVWPIIDTKLQTGAMQ